MFHFMLILFTLTLNHLSTTLDNNVRRVQVINFINTLIDTFQNCYKNEE